MVVRKSVNTVYKGSPFTTNISTMSQTMCACVCRSKFTTAILQNKRLLLLLFDNNSKFCTTEK